METVIGVLIVLAIVGGLAFGLKAVLQRRNAWKALTPEQQHHERAIRDADKHIKTTNKEYEKRIKDTRKALEKARTPQKLATFKTEHVGDWKDAFKGDRKFVLYDDHIETPSGEHPLMPNVAAVVDTAGNLMHKSRSTLTRMGAGTAIAGPIGFLVGVGAKKGQTVDKRELYLFVEGEDWADSTTCDPAKEGQKVRDFAQKVNLAARSVEGVKAERERRVTDLSVQLAGAEGDRTEIEAAGAARAALGASVLMTPDTEGDATTEPRA